MSKKHKAYRILLTPLAYIHVGDAAMEQIGRAIYRENLFVVGICTKSHSIGDD